MRIAAFAISRIDGWIVFAYPQAMVSEKAPGAEVAPLSPAFAGSCGVASGCVGLSHVAGVVAMIVGAFVLLGGWVFGSELIKTGVPGLAPMKANTALGLVLAGCSRPPFWKGAARLWSCLGLVRA